MPNLGRDLYDIRFPSGKQIQLEGVLQIGKFIQDSGTEEDDKIQVVIFDDPDDRSTPAHMLDNRVMIYGRRGLVYTPRDFALELHSPGMREWLVEHPEWGQRSRTEVLTSQGGAVWSANPDAITPVLPKNFVSDMGPMLNEFSTTEELLAWIDENRRCQDCNDDIKVFKSERGIEIAQYHNPTCPSWRAKQNGQRKPCPCGSGKRFKNCCGRSK